MICGLTSFLKHFMMVDVNATGQLSFRQLMLFFLRIGTMVEEFRQGRQQLGPLTE